MGHIQDMTDKQRIEFLADKYQKTKESRRGNSFEWWNDGKHDNLIENKGYKLFVFEGSFNRDSFTTGQIEAQEKVKELRDSNHYARVVCGYSQCMQKIKSFSVIYKPKSL